MKTFKHKNNGSTMTYKDGCMKIENLVIEGIPNLNYWEEVVKKEWEILSFINDRGVILYFEGEKCVRKSNGTSVVFVKDKTTVIQNGFSKIHSVKRLLDGEVFTLGDICHPLDYTDFKSSITKIFLLVSDKMRVKSNSYDLGINDLTKVKTPLCISTDGYEMYEDDIYYTPQRNLIGFYNLFMQFKVSTSSNFEDKNVKRFTKKENVEEFIRKENYNGKRFKTKEEVEQIILMNKPCLSLNDLLSVWGTCNTKEMYALSPLFSNFKKLANEKIVGRL